MKPANTPTSNRESRENREIKALTTMRAVAAALVFFYHFVYLENMRPSVSVLDAILENGFIGVTIFFVLSGFLLTLRYYGDVRDRQFRWGAYLKRRAARIYPVYFFILAGLGLSGTAINVTNLTLTQGFFAQFVQTGNIAAWSLTVEEAFYLILPFALSVLVRRRNLLFNLVLLIGWTLAMLGLGYGLIAWSNSSGIVQDGGFMSNATFMLTRTPFGYIFDFSVGIFAAILYLRRGAFGVRFSTALSLAGIAGVVACQCLMANLGDDVAKKPYVYVIAACVGLLLYGLTCEQAPLARIMAWSPFVYLGRISYALYLIQLTQFTFFMRPWSRVLFYAGTNVISAGLYQFIEEPARKLILRRRNYVPKIAPISTSAIDAS